MTTSYHAYDFSAVSVMVAEHNSYTRQTLRSILRTFNIGKISEADNVEAAWDVYQNVRPDIIFADWAPSFDGMALLRQIRRHPQSPNPFTPIVVVTSLTDQEHVLTARDLGMTEFLAKPFSPKLIYLRLQVIAERPRAFVRTGSFFGPDRRRRMVHVAEDRRGDGDAQTTQDDRTDTESGRDAPCATH